MRILVWGDSPAAGWIAGRLHQLTHETAWLTSPSIANDLHRFGTLHLHSPQRTMTVRNLQVATEIDAVLKPPLDWIMLVMPTWAVGTAVREMSRRIPPEHCPPIFVLSNGIGGIEKVEEHFPGDLALQGFPTQRFAWTTMRNDQHAFESIVSDGVGGLALTENPRATALARLFRTVGFGAVNIERREALQWSDVLWQMQANAIPTLLQITPEQLYDDGALFALEYRQLREAIAVIDRKNIALTDLPGVKVRQLGWQIRVLPEKWLRGVLKRNVPTPSLRSDIDLGMGRSDAAYLNGAVARAAYELNMHAPVNHTLAISVTDVAEGRAAWEQYTPTFLEALVRIATRS